MPRRNNRMEYDLRELRRQGRINMAIFFAGALGAGIPSLLFLLAQASGHDHGRYTFTGSPTLDAIGMSLALACVAGGACVGLRQKLRGG